MDDEQEGRMLALGWDGATTTPWYGSMRVFLQSEPYQWAPVIEQVRKELAAMT